MLPTTFTRRTALLLAAQGGLGLALTGCGGKASSGGETATQASGGSVAASAGAPTTARPSLFSQASLEAEEAPSSPAAPSYEIEPGLANVSVPESFYLTDAQRSKLQELGFCVNGNGWDSEFYPIYEENRYLQRANFVTCDSLMHTYHLYFQYLLKGLERGELSERLAEMSALMLEESTRQRGELAGSEWEDAARRNMVFFGVACALMDPSMSLPASIAADINDELDRITRASGKEPSVVTGADVDYTQFIVRGYYKGDETLERYFRTMMWYGQLSFYQENEDLDRSAALMTLALAGDAFECWEAIYLVTSFFAGSSDDNGYYEYAPVVAEAFGQDATCASLAGNDDGWQTYRQLTSQTPAPQITSLPGSDGKDLEQGKGFRFMGQRFSVDSSIFQKLMTIEGRSLPDALDIPAAFGSEEALSIVRDELGAPSGYEESVEGLRDKTSALTDTFWQASLYNQWLSALMPLLTPKGEGYPPFAQSAQWTRRELEGFLGSYTELKHDTVLYSKQAMAEGDGPIPQGDDDRGYVEPEPLLFSRLARLCDATSQGLDTFGLLRQQDKDDLAILKDLAAQLATIAAKELAGALPSDEEFELIRSIGVQLEHFWKQVYEEEAARTDTPLDVRQFPAPVVVDVATFDSNCLELATGNVRTMYVVVSVDGSLRVASGPVYSFYQFVQPSSDRMTDTAWRDLLRSSWNTPTEQTAPEPWTDGYCCYQ